MLAQSRAKRQINSPRKPSPVSSQSHDWKSNPVVVAAGSAAASVLLCIAIVTQIVIPTQTAKFEIEALKAKEIARDIQSRLDVEQKHRADLEQADASLKADVAALTAEVLALESQLLNARLGAMFSQGNPYPVDFGVIRIGAPISKIYEQFAKDQIEVDPHKPERLLVKIKDSPFVWVAYSYDKKNPTKKISSISFGLSYTKEFPKDFLRNKIIEALGEPWQHPEENYYRWRDSKGVGIYLISDLYIVMSPEYMPALWPE